MDKDSFKKFLAEVKTELEQRMLSLPFHFNLIDEMVKNNKNLNETAHSKILAKILQYQNEQNQYLFLKRLINSIGWNLEIKTPLFTLEPYCQEINAKNGRIDILIEDKDYAIIFENKINDATIQESQIARYISKVNERGYELNNIYVVLLKGRTNSQLNDGDMWKFRDKDYHDEFVKRYSEISFNEDILSLINEIHEMNINPLFNSAILLYKDFLERRFDLKNNKEYVEIFNLLQNKEVTEEKDLMNCINEYFKLLEQIRRMKRDGGIIEELTGLLNIQRSKINRYLPILYNNAYLNSKIQFHGVRTVHLGYNIIINGHSYLCYLGNNDQGLFCSVLKLEDIDFDVNLRNKLIELGLRSYNDTGYIFDRCDREYHYLSKLELFFKVMDKCEELKKQENKV